MTNKELVLRTREYLKPKSGHINIVDSLWKELNLSPEKQSELREVLLRGELVNLGTDQWTMQLTAKAILLKPDQLDDDGSIKPEEIIREQKEINIKAANIHIGDNLGNYSQSSDKSKSETTDKMTIKKIVIAVIIGIVVWLITQFILLPLIGSG